MSSIQRELPIKIQFSPAVHKPRKINQHIKRVWIQGPEEIVPEELQLEADEIAEGGTLLIEDMSLPAGCDVIDRRGNDPIVTVERIKKDKRQKQGKRGRDDDYDD
jgi:hypothetical protein